MYGERKTNARYPCTPPSTVETFGEEISAEACSGKEIAGLLRKIMMMMMNKWKNHFYKMKGDVGMSGHEKERKQEDAYTKIQTHS